MERISELTNKQYNALLEKSSEGHKYFFEAYALIYELKKLEEDNRAESKFLRIILGEIFSQDVVQENYIFYVKNSTYRVYDFVNKYARMVSKYYKIPKLNDWNDFKNIDNSQYNILPSDIKVEIKGLKNDKDLREILNARHSMTHNLLVKSRKDYISRWVLPLNGEEATTFKEWREYSEKKLAQTLENLTKLLGKTIEALINEKTLGGDKHVESSHI